VPPGGIDLSAAGVGNAGGNTPTVYEVWCYTDGDPNTVEFPCFEPGQEQPDFDLDDMNIIFQPNCGTGLAINNIGDFVFSCIGGFGGGGSCSLTGTGRPDPLLWLLVLLATVGLILRRRKYKKHVRRANHL